MAKSLPDSVRVAPDLESLSRSAAELFAATAADAIDRRGRFAVALSGGSTPGRLYRLLSTTAYRDKVPWSHCHFFWGDERLVDLDHPDSNYRLAWEALLSHLPLARDQIHPVPVGSGNPEAVAQDYEGEMRRFFGDGSLPCFDLILLGLGSDGHTASLFPGSPALDETHRWVVPTPPGRLPPNIPRVTLTLPVLNAARKALFLVSGSDKAAVLQRILKGDGELPAARVHPPEGELIWLVDRAAMAIPRLPRTPAELTGSDPLRSQEKTHEK